MAWVSAHEGIRDHPKTRALSRKLQCSRHEAIGILVTLWLWGLNNADRDGNILSANAEDIADGIMYRGQSIGQSAQDAAEYLLESLISTGWIDVADDGHFILHDWDEWQDQWYKALDKRAKEAERKRKQRQGGDDNEMSIGQSQGQDDGQSPGQDTGTSAPNRNRNRYHNRNLNLNRDPDRDSNTPPTPAGESVAPSIQEQRFNEFWASYPRKIAKAKAKQAWMKIHPDEELYARIISAVTKQKKSQQWLKNNGEFVPHPTTWLNGGRWDDEIVEVPQDGRNDVNPRNSGICSIGSAYQGGTGRPGALNGFKED